MSPTLESSSRIKNKDLTPDRGKVLSKRMVENDLSAFLFAAIAFSVFAASHFFAFSLVFHVALFGERAFIVCAGGLTRSKHENDWKN